MSEPIHSSEYIKAVARAMGMPEKGINSLEITAGYAEPVIVRFVYVMEGTAALLDALPTRESAKLEVRK